MSDKSYVGMGAAVCPICLTAHDEVVLIDRRLRNSFPAYGQKVCTGFELCPECKAQEQEYISFVELYKAPKPDDNPLQWKRTGRTSKVRRVVLPKILNLAIDGSKPLALVEEGFIAKLQARVGPARTKYDDMADDAKARLADFINNIAAWHSGAIAGQFHNLRNRLGVTA